VSPNNFVSELIHIFNRIGKSDPLSMSLYILFNVDLLELAWARDEDALGFIDDALAMAKGNTLQDNIDTLASFINREGGAFTWSEEHNSNFTIDKLTIMRFT
jgi:hypothetical protein